ncbi:hypothetical protein E2C01_011802 [Portunus trituberculatus]|uniref:Uncharacterized protein n=1 Tax=Portunus trituberculatus TaxID=210409 RepID=A0A5B7DC41_PORTR|nr:hypothetical protein [Portunus trituberculatus]
MHLLPQPHPFTTTTSTSTSTTSSTTTTTTTSTSTSTTSQAAPTHPSTHLPNPLPPVSVTSHCITASQPTGGLPNLCAGIPLTTKLSTHSDTRERNTGRHKEREEEKKGAMVVSRTTLNSEPIPGTTNMI